jgi:hypothetical protein
MKMSTGILNDADSKIIIAEVERRRVRVNETMAALGQHRANHGC